MSSEAKFVDGLRVYAPRENAPSFVKANIVVNVAELQAWLAGRSGEVRIDIKEARSGKYYASENDYQSQGERQPQARQQSKPAQRQEPSGGLDDDEPLPF